MRLACTKPPKGTTSKIAERLAALERMTVSELRLEYAEVFGELQPVDFKRGRPACLQAGVQIAPWRVVAGGGALGFVETAEGSDPNGGQTADSAPHSHGLFERVNASPRSGGDRNDGRVGASACPFPEQTSTSRVSTCGRTMSR
jgi:hypothetical protein